MSASQERQPTLDSIAPRIAVGDLVVNWLKVGTQILG